MANGAGVVVQECYAAPAEMWSIGNALSFAKELLPAKARKGKAKFKEEDGSFHRYSIGAYIISVQVFQKKSIGVQVQGKNYKGHDC